MRLKILVAAVVVAQALAIHFGVARQFPLSGDDHSYVYQARLFAAGRVYAQDPLYDYRHPLHRCIELACARDHEGRRFSKYAPGWSLALAPGVVLGAPWIVQPLVAALLVCLLLGHVERRHGPRAMHAAALLLTLSAFFAYYAASYRPHMPTALCVFGAFLAHERARDGHGSRASAWSALAGAFLGASTLMRYLDWVALGALIAIDLLRHRRRDLALFLVSFAIPASGNLLYGSMLSGHPLTPPTHLGGTAGDHDQLMLSLRSLDVTARRLLMLVALFPPILLFVRYWSRARTAELDPRPLILFVANAVVYSLFVAATGGPGPRYLFGYFPFLILTVVELRERCMRDGTAADRLWWRGVVAGQIAASLIFIGREAYIMQGRRDVERTLARTASSGGRRAVLLTTGTYDTDVKDLTRNPPDLDLAETLYFSDCSADQLVALRERFPDREWLTYAYPGTLSPLRSASSSARTR